MSVRSVPLLPVSCRGPVDQHGNPKPDGTTRIGLACRGRDATHFIILMPDEAKQLIEQISEALDQIEQNRCGRQKD